MEANFYQTTQLPISLDLLITQEASWLVGWLGWLGWLVVWLVGWLAGWLDGVLLVL
jgi:hypothetical protein